MTQTRTNEVARQREMAAKFRKLAAEAEAGAKRGVAAAFARIAERHEELAATLAARAAA